MGTGNNNSHQLGIKHITDPAIDYKDNIVKIFNRNHVYAYGLMENGRLWHIQGGVFIYHQHRISGDIPDEAVVVEDDYYYTYLEGVTSVTFNNSYYNGTRVHTTHGTYELSVVAPNYRHSAIPYVPFKEDEPREVDLGSAPNAGWGFPLYGRVHDDGNFEVSSNHPGLGGSGYHDGTWISLGKIRHYDSIGTGSSAKVRFLFPDGTFTQLDIHGYKILATNVKSWVGNFTIKTEASDVILDDRGVYRVDTGTLLFPGATDAQLRSNGNYVLYGLRMESAGETITFPYEDFGYDSCTVIDVALDIGFIVVADVTRDGVIYRESFRYSLDKWSKYSKPSRPGPEVHNTVFYDYVPIPKSEGAASISLGAYHSVFVMKNKTVKVCGDSSYGVLGLEELNENGYTKDVEELKQIPGLTDIVQASTMYDHTLFRTEQGHALGCGYAYNGQLGEPRSSVFSPERLVSTEGPISNVKQVVAGKGISLILLNTGVVLSSGSNTYGQHGNGTTTRIERFSPIKDIPKVRSVHCGEDFVILILENNTALGAGSNHDGALGFSSNVTRVSSFTPLSINGETIKNIDTCVCGRDFTFLIMKDGTIKATGYNLYCQSGYTSSTNVVYEFTDIPLTKAEQIATGREHSVFMNKGLLYGNGSHSTGQLGLGKDVDPNNHARQVIDVPAVQLVWDWYEVIEKDGNVYVKKPTGWIKADAVYVKTSSGWVKSEGNVRAKTQKGWR